MFEKLFFKNIVSRVVPTVKADDEEDLVDPQQVLREKCRTSSHCKHLAEKLEQCNARVTSRTRTAETCTEELFDLLHAVDHCVTEQLWSKLK